MSAEGNVPELGADPPSNTTSQDSERTCWICFATESENRMANWLHPCQCRGSTKWVHESCLYRWIDEKQNGNSRARVACMQCRVEYIIIFPRVGRVASLLERFQDLIRQCSPFVAASAFLGSVYWTAVTYGGITVIQVLGQQRGMELMEKGDPFFLLIGLPFIPVALILTRLIRWEDAVLRLWHNRHSIVRKLPLINWLFDGQANVTETTNEYTLPPVTDEPADFARIFCGGILLPSIATIMGNVIYRNMSAPLYRTLLGGLTFIGVKGILKIYLRQKQYLNKTRRHIVDYTEENLRTYMPPGRSHTLAEHRQVAGYEEVDSDFGEEYLDVEETENDLAADINILGVNGGRFRNDMNMNMNANLNPNPNANPNPNPNANANANIDVAGDVNMQMNLNNPSNELNHMEELSPSNPIDIELDDVRDHVIISVPDRPYTLFLS